jgi:ketosteroid isomerase-like protein
MRPDLELLAANRAFYAAFEALDLEAMSAVWSDEDPVSCLHPAGAPLMGRAQVLASWRGIFRSTYAIKLTLREPRVLVVGTAAWIVLIEEADLHHEDGRLRGEAFATNIFLRKTVGWRMVHHHVSSTFNARREPINPDDEEDDDEDEESPPGTVLN